MNGKLKLIAPVTLIFVVLCWVAFGICASQNPYFNDITPYFFAPYQVNFNEPAQLVRLITHVFGQTNFNELCVNSIIILAVGQIAEKKMKSPLNILAVMIVSALATGLVHTFWRPDISMSGCTCIALAIAALGAIIPDGDQFSISLVATFFVFLVFCAMRIREIGLSESNVLFSHAIGAVIGVAIGALLHK